MTATRLAPLTVQAGGLSGLIAVRLGSQPLRDCHMVDVIKLCCTRVECEKRMVFTSARMKFFGAKMNGQRGNLSKDGMRRI